MISSRWSHVVSSFQLLEMFVLKALQVDEGPEAGLGAPARKETRPRSLHQGSHIQKMPKKSLALE